MEIKIEDRLLIISITEGYKVGFFFVGSLGIVQLDPDEPKVEELEHWILTKFDVVREHVSESDVENHKKAIEAIKSEITCKAVLVIEDSNMVALKLND